MNLIRNALIFLSAICGPVMLGSMIWGLALIKEQVGLPIWFVIIACYVMVGLGLASLLDKREHQSRRQTDEPQS